MVSPVGVLKPPSLLLVDGFKVFYLIQGRDKLGVRHVTSRIRHVISVIKTRVSDMVNRVTRPI